MINIQKLLNEAQCYETVQELSWPDGVQSAKAKASIEVGAKVKTMLVKNTSAKNAAII